MIPNPAASSEFTVTSGEQIVVSIESIGCACNTGGAFDNVPLKQDSQSPDVYSFTVNGTSGEQHFLNYVCHFFPGDIPTATYDISVTGNGGGGTVLARTVGKQLSPPASFQLTFDVA
jgi:hypothetical protein